MKPYYSHADITIYHGDCREILPTLEGGSVDLVLTDPPYGIGERSTQAATRAKSFGSQTYGEKNSRRRVVESTDFGHFDWDSKVDRFPIDELRRVSQHQIIFGGNYYADWLPPSSCWLVWDKDNSGDFADCELAWTSFSKAVRKFRYRWNGMLQEPGTPKEQRLYPTQKPLALMRWCIGLAPDVPTLILDPFMGGGSTLRAAKDMRIKAIGIDKRETACEIAAKRLSQESFAMNTIDTPRYKASDIFAGESE